MPLDCDVKVLGRMGILRGKGKSSPRGRLDITDSEILIKRPNVVSPDVNEPK